MWRVVRLVIVAAACVVVALAPRKRTRRAAAALVALGIVATPSGAAIGYSYLTALLRWRTVVRDGEGTE